MKLTRKQLKRLIEAAVTLSDDEISAADDAIDKAIDEPTGIDKDAVIDAYVKDKEAQTESLEKLPIYKKYSYGLDKIPDAGKAEDDIIGHT